MGQSHLIIKSFKDRVATNEALNNALPGKLQQGTHAATGTLLPYGLIVVTELSRKYHSGGSPTVEYEATVTIYGNQKVGDVGNIQDLFAVAFNTSRNLPSVVGQVRPMMPTEATLIEDEESEHGKDTMRSTQAWRILIQQTGLVFPVGVES